MHAQYTFSRPLVTIAQASVARADAAELRTTAMTRKYRVTLACATDTDGREKVSVSGMTDFTAPCEFSQPSPPTQIH